MASCFLFSSAFMLKSVSNYRSCSKGYHIKYINIPSERNCQSNDEMDPNSYRIESLKGGIIAGEYYLAILRML